MHENERRYGLSSGLTTANIKPLVSSGPRRTVQGGEELEAVLQVRHHAIYRWCPDAGSSAQVACIFFHCFPHLGIVDPLLSFCPYFCRAPSWCIWCICCFKCCFGHRWEVSILREYITVGARMAPIDQCNPSSSQLRSYDHTLYSFFHLAILF